MIAPVKSHDGFTLVELMIAMAIAGIIVAAIFMTFTSQQKSQVTQQLVVDMQQNTRAALFMMQREIRMAGFDPTWDDGNDDGKDDNRISDGVDNDCDGQGDGDDPDNNEANDIAGIVKAAPHHIQIRLDRDGNADFCSGDELLAFGFPGVADGNGDGIADAGAAQLKRGLGAAALNQPIAEDIHAVAFAYAFDFDAGAPTTDGELDTYGGNIIWGYDSNGNGEIDMALDTNNDGVINAGDDANGDGFLNDSPLPNPAPVNSIRAIQMWILARTRAPIRDYSDTTTYIVGNKIITPGDTDGNGTIDGSDSTDSYKRNLLATTVKCRNMGLR